MTRIDRDARVYVAGHRGLVGSALVRHLEAEGFTNLLTATRDELDLRDQSEVSDWFKANRPDYVFLVAGTVGGILANSTRPAEFIYDNLMIHGTVVHSAHETDVKKLLYLGSSCIYPRDATQPITAEAMIASGLIRRVLDGVRVLAKGEITSAITLTVTGASAAAVEAVAAAGGTLTVAEALPPHGKSVRKTKVE